MSPLFLQPIVSSYPSYLRDTKHLLNIFKNTPIYSNSILVTIDVESLYTSLKQKDIIIIDTTSLALLLKMDLKKEQQEFILSLLKLAMSNNYFWHSGKFYKQIRGVAMGAKYAPSVANILLSVWEATTIFGQKRPEISLYKKYIDDIVIVWNGDVDHLTQFLQDLIANKYGLHFTGNWSHEEISFLDLIIKKEWGQNQNKNIRLFWNYLCQDFIS